MKVKALCTIKDENGWHNAGEVFETETDLGNLAEILDKPEKAEKAEEPQEEQAPKAKATRRKKNLE